MQPILISIAGVTIFNFSIFVIAAWLVFSFLFWRALRIHGTDEDRIFDLTFYATVAAFVVSRLSFVVTHWELFSETWLKIFALWVQPGLSLYGALLGGVGTLIVMSRQSKVRLGMVLDALAVAIPIPLVIGLIGAFLDGAVAGRIADLPWAMRTVGFVGRRHPVALYDAVALVGIIAVLAVFSRRFAREKRPYGLLGVWFFLIYSASMFILEMFKESHVYWLLTANQWVMVALFAESVGALYVRGGGREWVRPLFHKMRSMNLKMLGGIYAKFSKRRS